MTAPCVEEDDLLRLADGELTENDAARVRDHLRGCAVCRARDEALRAVLGDLRAPLGANDAAAIDAVMRRLATATPDPIALPRAVPRARRALWAGGLAAALVAGVAVVPRLAPHVGDPGLEARGRPIGGSLARGVGLSVYRVASPRDALARGGVAVAPDEAYALRYTNLLRDSVYVLAFAIDAAGTVHWVSPAYVDPQTNPEAVALAPSTAERSLPSGTALEGPAPGAMRFVAVVSRAPLHVLDVDALRGADLALASLRARWPAADVRELATVTVGQAR
jgi:hypothetical protein